MNTPVYPNKTLNQQILEEYSNVIFEILLIAFVPFITKTVPREVNVHNFGITIRVYII